MVKPGDFKDTLTGKDETTVAKLMSFLFTHFGDKGTTELLQELITARQLKSERPQQLLYMVVGYVIFQQDSQSKN